MALNSYLTLGRSGLRVSPLCLGTMTFGDDWGWGTQADEAETILTAYLEKGGNFIDTANIYTNGHSEAIIGNYFFSGKWARERVVISTKFFCSLHEGDPNGGGAGRKALIQQCEESLRRLKSDYIDLYWLHSYDPGTPIEETMRGLDDLVTSGKIRYIGISDLPAWSVNQAQMTAQLRGWAPVIAMQLEYSLLERTSDWELLPMAKANGIGVMPWSPLKGGLLSGKFRRGRAAALSVGRAASAACSDRDFDIIEELVAIAEELAVTPAAVALSWVMTRSGIASPLVGARTLDQLEQNLLAFEVQLTNEQHSRLDAVSAPMPFFPHTLLNSPYGTQVGFPSTTVDGVTYGPSPVLGANSRRY